MAAVTTKRTPDSCFSSQN